LEIIRVWYSEVGFVLIGVFNDFCFATKSEIKFVQFCQQMGWGIPLDYNIKDFSESEFFDYAKTHPVLSSIKSWNEVGLTKPKLYT